MWCGGWSGWFLLGPVHWGRGWVVGVATLHVAQVYPQLLQQSLLVPDQNSVICKFENVKMYFLDKGDLLPCSSGILKLSEKVTLILF